MLKLRIREYSPTGEKGRVLPTIGDTLEVTTRLNATPTISFSMSTIMAGKMPDDGFIVGAEYAIGNGRYQPLPQHDRFIVTEDDSDDVDPSKVINFRGESYMVWLLAHTYVHWSKSAKNNQRTITGNAGYLMRAFINEAKGRGWGSQLTFDFTNLKDSAGVNWTGADSSVIDWQLLTPVTQVVEKITEMGLCDWTVEGHNFRLFRHNTLGTDKTESVLGKSVHRAPIKTDMSEIFTNLTVVPEKARYWLYLSNPAAPSKYGRLEATMTQSGISSHAEATKLAQPSLLKGRTIVREESFEYSPTPGALTPWEDYNLGDRLSVRVRGEKIARRVIGIIARMENGTATVQTVVGDPISSTMKKALDRVGAASMGDIIGGTGDSFPATPGPSPLEPAMPNNLRVTANTSEWSDDYKAISHVTLEWEAVTEAVDESEIDIVQYEVWSRTGGNELSRDTAVIGNKVTLSDWESGVPRIVVVRAQSTTGAWSEYSLDLPVTPDFPISIVPKAPSGLTVTSNIGEFTANGVISTVNLSWSAVTESIDDEPIEVVEYELWSGNAPGARVSETNATVTMPAGAEKTYQVRALTKGGQWGDLSTGLDVTGALPPVATRAPVAPILTTGYGNVFARWNGSYASGGTAGAHSVRVEARVGSSGAWIVQGALIEAGEQLISPGDVGETVQVRLVAIDQIGRVTGTSATASTVREGLDLAGLSEDVLDEFAAIESAASAAQGAASAAQDDADQAIADALAAANAASAAQGTATSAANAAAAIQSRGNDLITNGNASLGSLNFSTFVLETGDQPVGAQGAFWIGTNGQTAQMLDERIQVDPSKSYLASMSVKQVTPGVFSRFYFGLAPFDAFGISISPVNYMERAGTRTTLVHALEPGATSIELESADGWYQDEGSAFYRRITFWNYVDASGKAWEPGTYSRNLSETDLWSAGGISGNTITLRVPYSGPSYPAGTVVGNSSSGGNYMYAPGMANTAATEEWTNYVQTVPFHGVHTDPSLAASTSFPAATASVRVILLSNYGVSGGVSKQLFANVSLSDVAAAEAIANSKGKTIIQSAAPAAADRLPQNLWIDTTGGANTPKRWTSGTTWVAVTDKAATDAAAAAVTAKNRADDAFVAATAAATAAGNAQTTANGKNRVWYQTTQPTGAGHRVDDVWYDTDDGYKMHRWTGSIWSATQFGTNAIANLAITNAQIANATIQDAKIATLDAAKITTGYLAAARIAANTIVAAHLSTDSVTAAKILADEAFFTKVFTDTLMAGRIMVDHLSPNVGENLNLSANGSIVLLAGQQEDLSSEVAAAQDSATTAQNTASNASTQAAAADAAAEIADGKAEGADGKAQAAVEGLAVQQAMFVVTPTGAEVRASPVGSSDIVRIEPTGVEIIQANVAVSKWDGARFISNEIISNRAQLANHVIEKSGTRTVIRAL